MVTDCRMSDMTIEIFLTYLSAETSIESQKIYLVFPDTPSDCYSDDSEDDTTNGTQDGSSDDTSDGTTDSTNDDTSECNVSENYVNGSEDQFDYWIGESTSELKLDSGFDATGDCGSNLEGYSKFYYDDSDGARYDLA